MAQRDTRPAASANQSTPGNTDRLVTVREAMSRLTLSRSTLWRFREELPHIPLTPTRVAIRERDIQAFIERRVGKVGAA